MDVHEVPSTELKMECPFTWGLDLELVANFHKETTTITNYEDSPVMCFIDTNTFAYIRSMQSKLDDAEKLVEEINRVWDNIYESISKQEVYSVDVLMHIKDATAYHIYSKIGKKEKAKEIEIHMIDANNFNTDIEKGTIFGAQAVASGIFFEHGVDTCIELAKKASSYAPECALWHYFIAKSLRIKRRYNNFCAKVSEEEKNEFLKCYELSNSLDYGTFVARMYKESKNWKKCSEIYNQIYRKQPERQKIRLILALYFMDCKDFDGMDKAKKCLDYVERNVPEEKRSKAYYHYWAKYHEKTGKYEEAKENYLRATRKGDNFPADMDYLNLMSKTLKSNDNSDVIKHHFSMLKKYTDKKSYIVRIYLNLGATYLFQNGNLKLAADYFLKAIKEDSCDSQLENFQIRWKDETKYNVFDLIRTRILTGNENSYEDTFKELKSYCMEYENRKESVITENSDKDSLYQQFAKALSIKE